MRELKERSKLGETETRKKQKFPSACLLKFSSFPCQVNHLEKDCWQSKIILKGTEFLFKIAKGSGKPFFRIVGVLLYFELSEKGFQSFIIYV